MLNLSSKIINTWFNKGNWLILKLLLPGHSSEILN